MSEFSWPTAARWELFGSDTAGWALVLVADDDDRLESCLAFDTEEDARNFVRWLALPDGGASLDVLPSGRTSLPSDERHSWAYKNLELQRGSLRFDTEERDDLADVWDEKEEEWGLRDALKTIAGATCYCGKNDHTGCMADEARKALGWGSGRGVVLGSDPDAVD